ncbi:MAG: DUF86 domain-containing protein [Campylobacterales bacterium]|nr:DUF86 domain-containing protein [Campylobacterales bacterium]
MSDTLSFELTSQIIEATQKVLRRTENIKNANDFLINDASLEKLDAVCMQLIAIGEGLKKLDDITKGVLLSRHNGIEWRKAMAMRDILSHHYFDLNAEIVFNTCKNKLPQMLEALEALLKEL